MDLVKFSDKYFADYISMCKEFYSSDAVISAINLENIHSTFNEIVSNSPLCDGYVFLVDGKVAGYIQISFTWNNDLGGKVIFIEELFVKSEFRSQGLGTKVLNEIYIKFNNIKAYRLEVSIDNIGAIELYKRLSYVERKYSQYYIVRSENVVIN